MGLVALTQLVLEQAALDDQKFDAAWLLSLQQEPPAQIFAFLLAPSLARAFA